MAHMGDKPTPPATHTTTSTAAPTTSTTAPTTTASPEQRAAPFSQAFQVMYAKPGEAEPRLQNALIDDHHILKTDLRAASAVVNQLRPLGVWMTLDWSTGASTAFGGENQAAFDDLELYLNYKLTPEEFMVVGESIKWICDTDKCHPPGVTP
jgi:hypothetical protein